MKEYSITYTDDREGDLRRTTVVAEDESSALDIAMKEDYYFGKIIDITENIV